MMRVLTQNLWGVRGAWELRRAVLKRGLAELKPDIVSFQEAIKTHDVDTAADLFGAGFEVVFQSHSEPNGQTAAIASRWPITAVRELDQHVTRRVDSASATLVAEVEAPAPIGPVLVVNHLPCWQLAYEYERELQAKAAGLFRRGAGRRPQDPRNRGRGSDRPARFGERPILDGTAVAVRRERLLSRCLGGCAWR